MELRKKSNTNENKSIFSKRQERVQMQVDLANISHITSLLTDLYVNPIEATVRETISNAIDTTRRLPKEQRKPVSISLPTEFNPEFVVTDLGEGMDRETLSMVFAQYGASTKGTDLQQIGAFGLGAKAPLSYASKFSVESTKDGITTEVFLSTTSEGNFCDILDSRETGKPNGTMVTIPVNVDNKSDFKKFEQAVFDNYAVFSYGVELDIKGLDVPTYFQEEIGRIKVGEVNGETVYSKIYSVTETEEEFIKDLLGLPLNESNIEERIVQHGMGYTLSGWNYSLNKGRMFYLELVPGMVDFSSSRDEITLNERFETVKELIEDQIVEVLKEKRIAVLKDRKWNSLEAVENLKGFTIDEIEDFNPEINGRLFVDMLTNVEESVIPLEFSLVFPKKKDTSFVMYNDKLNKSLYWKISNAKNDYFENMKDFRQPIERILFSEKNGLLIISDIPKESTEKQHTLVMRKLLNKLRTFNYGLFYNHESGKTYVGTHSSKEDIEKVKNYCGRLSSARIIPYEEVIGSEQKKKTSNVSESFRCHISEQKKESSIYFSPNAFDSFLQVKTDFSEVESSKNKKLLVINNANNSWNVHKLKSEIFWFIKNEGLDTLDIIFTRKSELTKERLKELMPMVDYYVVLSGCNLQVTKDIQSLMKGKNFYELESIKAEPIPSRLFLYSQVRGDYKIGTFRKLLNENQIDQKLFLDDDVIVALFGEEDDKEYRLLMEYGTSEDVEFTKREKEIYQVFRSIKELLNCVDTTFNFTWGERLLVADDNDTELLKNLLVDYMKAKWEQLNS